MTDEWVNTISKKYIELFEKVIGEDFVPENHSDEETYQAIIQSLKTL